MTDQLLKHVFSLNFANASFIDGTGVLETKKEHIERLEYLSLIITESKFLTIP